MKYQIICNFFRDLVAWRGRSIIVAPSKESKAHTEVPSRRLYVHHRDGECDFLLGVGKFASQGRPCRGRSPHIHQDWSKVRKVKMEDHVEYVPRSETSDERGEDSSGP